MGLLGGETDIWQKPQHMENLPKKREPAGCLQGAKESDQ